MLLISIDYALCLRQGPHTPRSILRTIHDVGGPPRACGRGFSEYLLPSRELVRFDAECKINLRLGTPCATGNTSPF